MSAGWGGGGCCEESSEGEVGGGFGCGTGHGDDDMGETTARELGTICKQN